MASPDPSREIPAPAFADDDGTADATLAQALIRHAAGRAPLTEVVEALACARVLVPVVASGHLRPAAKGGPDPDAAAPTGVMALQMPDGRTALPVFTDIEAMRAWRPEARAVPAEARGAAMAAVSAGWSTLILNPAMESTVIPRPAVWALAQGEPWRPAVVGGVVDAEVASAIRAAVAVAPEVTSAEVGPGRVAEIGVVLGLAPGLGRDELEGVIARVRAAIGTSEVAAERVDGVEIVVRAADA